MHSIFFVNATVKHNHILGSCIFISENTHLSIKFLNYNCTHSSISIGFFYLNICNIKFLFINKCTVFDLNHWVMVSYVRTALLCSLD